MKGTKGIIIAASGRFKNRRVNKNKMTRAKNCFGLGGTVRVVIDLRQLLFACCSGVLVVETKLVRI